MIMISRNALAGTVIVLLACFYSYCLAEEIVDEGYIVTDPPMLTESDDGSGDIDNLQTPTKLDNSVDVFEYIEESGQQDADDGDGDDGNKDSDQLPGIVVAGIVIGVLAILVLVAGVVVVVHRHRARNSSAKLSYDNILYNKKREHKETV